MDIEVPKDAEISWFKSLKERRVFQILGFYIGASWGVIQFVEWIVERYGLSPFLPDFSLVVLFSLIPSVLVVAYYHGRPGPDKWTKVEKISIPINLMLTMSLLTFIFSGKDLGAATKLMTVENEEGQMIERVVAKAVFRKKVVLFNLKNNTDDSELDWLESGLPFGVHVDLLQDPFMDGVSQLLNGGVLLRRIKKAGFDRGVDLPITLMQQIATELHFDYFISGEIKKSDKGDFIVTTKLNETLRGNQISNQQFKSNDLFSLVDQLSSTLKRDLGVPDYQTDSIQDLPVKELVSNQFGANRDLVMGLKESIENNDYQTSINWLKSATEKDPSFAMAYLFLGLNHANNNQSEESLLALKKALKFNYKLPDFLRFLAKDIYYIMTGEGKKRLGLLKMQVELYSDNVDIRMQLANAYSNSKMYKEAIAEINKIQAISSRPETYLDDIGLLYIRLNDLPRALSFMKKYAEKFPEEIASFNYLGYIYWLIGNDELARKNYEKSLFLEPNNLTATLRLANLDEKHGYFRQAEETYLSALSQAEDAQDRYRIFEHLMLISEIKGQPKKALDYRKRGMSEMAKFQPPLNQIIENLINIEYFVRAGELEQAIDVLTSADETLSAPFENLSSLGKALYYTEIKDTENAEEQLLILDETLKKLGPTTGGLSWVSVKLRAVIAGLKNDHQSEIHGFETYAKTNQRDRSRFYLIGKAYNSAGNIEQAEIYLEKQLGLTPFDPLTHMEIGSLFLKSNRNILAQKHFATASDIWKDAEPEFKSAMLNDKLLTQAKKQSK